MGLENLKSVFTKGLEKFRNTELKTFPRPILGQNYPSTPEKESVIGHQVDYPSPLEEKHMENKFKSSGESNNDVGLFNSVDNKYSYSYATINKPQGYLNSPFGNDIFSLGNINSNGSGYSEKYKSLMSLYKEIRGSTPSIYFANALPPFLISPPRLMCGYLFCGLPNKSSKNCFLSGFSTIVAISFILFLFASLVLAFCIATATSSKLDNLIFIPIISDNNFFSCKDKALINSLS